MSERKFTKVMTKPGMAAQLRETVSQVVRESAVQKRPHLPDPLDFEEFLRRNKTLIQNDPHRELLLYPPDDVTHVTLPLRPRTVVSSVPPLPAKNVDGDPEGDKANAPPLLTKQALQTYSSNYHVVHHKYHAYGGTCHDLPRLPKSEPLREELFEVDTDADQIDDVMSRSHSDGIRKQGHLLKGPDTSSDRMFAHIGSKSFKRRYCYLRQEVDGTYILELHKDEKKGDAKATIVMDFCTDVVTNTKKGRYGFELKMIEGHRSYTLAADCEAEMQDWVAKLKAVIEQIKLQEEKRAASLERASLQSAPPSPAPSPSLTYGTLKGLEQSMNPQLIRYSRETDISIASSRKEGRRRLFSGYVHPSKATPQPNVEPYREQFGQRISLVCESLKFRLQAPVDGEKESLCQVEPYFTSLCLYDARANRKLTENFYFDVNHDVCRKLLENNNGPSSATYNGTTNGCSNGNGDDKSSSPSTNGHSGDNGKNGCKTVNGSACGDGEDSGMFDAKWMEHPRQAILSVTNPHPDVFLVVRIDKVLQGSICNTSEPYLKATKDPRLGLKVHKSVKTYCQRLGQYRMPFAWAARPLFRLYSNELDTTSEFPSIYRQEGNKLKDEDLLKLLADFRKPDKLNKLTVVPGWLRISLQPLTELPENCLTTSLLPLRPFPNPPTCEPTIEIAEFQSVSDRDVHPYTVFTNHLYVYPQSLMFDTQKIFNRARNIGCIVELRDSDAKDAQPIKCIYGRPGGLPLTTRVICPVVHHNTTPTFYEEIKIRLPITLNSSHHILFIFMHISCEISKKKDCNSDSCVGYAWVPLLSKGKLNLDTQTIAVSTHLPPGYLSIQPLGLGKGNAGPEITWIDSQRPLFTISFNLNSTVLTQDVHLQNLFSHAEKLMDNKPSAVPSESETCKILKAAHAIQTVTAITFLPTILNQLFALLVITSSEEVGHNIIRLLVHVIHMIHESGRNDILQSYVKYSFILPQNDHIANGRTPNGSPVNGNTVHGELCRHLPTLLNPANTDFLLVNKFMLHSGLFFDIIIKSMAQHLLNSGRIKMHRNERFPPEFQLKLEALVVILVPYLVSRYKDMPVETHQLNKSLASFLNKSLSFMDRGLVFRLIRVYVESFTYGSPRTLQEFKLSFLQEICSHEHYVSFNLPIQHSPKGIKPDLITQYCLSEEFCRQHFLVGVLLQEVRASLNEIPYVRKIALGILKDLMAKHEFDDRYQSKGQLQRIAMLYIPWLVVVLENFHRLHTVDNKKKSEVNGSLSRISMGSAMNSLSSHTNSFPLNNNMKRFTMHIDGSVPLRTSMLLKDSNYFAAIAGITNGTSSMSLDSNGSTMSDGKSTISQETTVVRNDKDNLNSGHNRSVSATQPVYRCDKLQANEIADVLHCFLFIIKHISEHQMIAWWRNCSELEIINFFTILELCLHTFKYTGRKNALASSSDESTAASTLSSASTSAADGVNRRTNVTKARTLPARINPPTTNSDYTLETGTLTHTGRENLVETENETSRLQQALQSANLSTEIGMICLDCMGLYCMHFREALVNGPIMERVASVYLSYLEIGQGECLSKHVFASLRAFINNFSHALFKGNASLCGRLCYELLRCCDSRLISIRQESCAVLYLLMRSNFEFSGRKGITRVHLQVIISVSQMLGKVIGLNNARFQESLSLINSYANSDKAMKGSGFPVEVKDLTKRIRTVLMATAQMRAHQSDPELLLGLQYALANSYAATPELRHTWLQAMARNHRNDGNYSEAACCQLHIAALMAEYLRLKDDSSDNKHSWGAEALASVSCNIPVDERGLKLDAGVHETQYTEQQLLEQLEACAESLELSERYELLGSLYRLILPIHERRRDYEALAACYGRLREACLRVAEVARTGKRLLGRYYRVAFFGRAYFEEEDGAEYVYKEPKLTGLGEITERLHKLYSDKFGVEVVRMVTDSSQVDEASLDSRLAYIQVTHLTPHWEPGELPEHCSEFELNHDVRTFMYEAPFTRDGRTRGTPMDQWKRRTILTTQYAFPYVLKRIPVTGKRSVELSPIEVALDEMRSRVSELEEAVAARPLDAKKLQLRLQGSVCVQVNAGPLAYATVFLDPALSLQYPEDKVEELKDVFREFVRICNEALRVNDRLITTEQQEYQNALRDNFQKMCEQLSQLFNESLWPLQDECGQRDSMALFSAISGAQYNSSTA